MRTARIWRPPPFRTASVPRVTPKGSFARSRHPRRRSAWHPASMRPRHRSPLRRMLTVYEFREGWAWVQLHDDGYVGYTTVDNLSAVVEENSHRVSARLTYLYPAPDIKRPPITRLSFSSTVAPRHSKAASSKSRAAATFSRTISSASASRQGLRPGGGAIRRRSLSLGWQDRAWHRLLGACAGRAQAAGIPCLRDSDMQMHSAGEPMDPSNLEAIQRGDLLFWKGHVAIAQSADWMLHASGHHMQVVVEPIRRAIERTAEAGGPLLAILRPPTVQQPPVQQRVAAEHSLPSPYSNRQPPSLPHPRKTRHHSPRQPAHWPRLPCKPHCTTGSEACGACTGKQTGANRTTGCNSGGQRSQQRRARNRQGRENRRGPDPRKPGGGTQRTGRNAPGARKKTRPNAAR